MPKRESCGSILLAPRPPSRSPPTYDPIALAALPGAILPRLRALALFGRRSPQRVDSLVMPASENLHNSGLMRRTKRWSSRSPRRQKSTAVARLVSLKTCAVLQLMTSLNRVRRLCRCAGGTFPKRQHANLPVCWLAPGPPVRRTNQNRLMSPYIVPNPRFSATWKTAWHNAGLANFANF